MYVERANDLNSKLNFLIYTVPINEAGFPNKQVSNHNNFGYFQPVTNISLLFIQFQYSDHVNEDLGFQSTSDSAYEACCAFAVYK